MAQPNSNIIPLQSDRPLGSNPLVASERQDAITDRIRTQCRSIYRNDLASLYHEYFTDLNGELSSLSAKFENRGLNPVYSGALHYLRRKRCRIERQLVQSALKEFDDFWNDRNGPAPNERNNEQNHNRYRALGIGDNRADADGSPAIDPMDRRLRAELYELDRRFAALIGQSAFDSRYNPVGPDRIWHNFAETVTGLPLDFGIKQLMYRRFGAVVSQRLAILYGNINSALRKEQVLPGLSRDVPPLEAGPASVPVRGPLPATPNPNGTPVGDGVKRQVGTRSEPCAFQTLQAIFDAWRTQEGLSIPGDCGFSKFPGNVSDKSDDVLIALTSLQDARAEYGFRSAHRLKTDLTDQLRSIVPGSEEYVLARREENVIDLVGLTFDYLLDETRSHLPGPVRRLIGLLMVPIVKVVMLEPEFFSEGSHPARALLNTIIAAGSELDPKSVEDSPRIAEIQSIVEMVLSKFDQDTAVFSELWERLNAFLEKEKQHAELAEARIRQVIESKEQLEIAKSRIGYALIRCIQDSELPAFLKSFLNDVWKHVMLLAYLRRATSIAGWQRASGVVSRLVWTITPVDDIPEKRKILQEIPHLAKDICIGLEEISFDPHKTAVFFQQLEACQMAALNEPGTNAEMISDVPTPFYSVSWREKATNPGERNRMREVDIDALMAEMSEVDESMFHDLDRWSESQSTVRISQWAIPTESMSGKLDDRAADRSGETIRHIEVGQWWRLKNERHDPFKAKLCWMSPLTSRCVFVNYKGAKIANKTLRELAAEMGSGDACLYENASVPAIDRALAAMIERLSKR